MAALFEEQRTQIQVDLADLVVRRVSIVVHDSNLQALILQLLVCNLQLKPFGIPDRRQRMPADLGFARETADFDLVVVEDDRSVICVNSLAALNGGNLKAVDRCYSVCLIDRTHAFSNCLSVFSIARDDFLTNFPGSLN